MCETILAQVYYAKFDPKEDVSLTSAAELIKEEKDRNTYIAPAAQAAAAGEKAKPVVDHKVRKDLDHTKYISTYHFCRRRLACI